MAIDEHVVTGRQNRTLLPAVLVTLAFPLSCGLAQMALPNLNDPSAKAARAAIGLVAVALCLFFGLLVGAYTLRVNGGEPVSLRVTQHRLLLGEVELGWEDLSDIAFFSWGVVWTTRQGVQGRLGIRLGAKERFRLTELAADLLEASREGRPDPAARAALDTLRGRS
ncbi:MAG: hypothetical protein KC912_10580 [Proteobacteria bacterium]|nr:hypothetical protein [Pseudomonadota bacterium]